MVSQIQNESYDGISVIIPVYNASKYLHRTIDSVLNQTYKDIELILVNDGSKDDSLSICREYEDKDGRVVVIDKENGGNSSARNAGIDRATKKYIAFMDNDDYMIPTYLETMHKYITMDGGRDMLVANAFHIQSDIFDPSMDLLNDDGHTNPILVDICNEEELKRKFTSLDLSHIATVWNKLFVRQIILDNHLRFETIQSEDDIFSLKYLLLIKSLRTIMGFRGYCFLLRQETLSHTHHYLVELNWVCKMISLHKSIIDKFEITDDNYISKVKLTIVWIVKSRMLIKGYYSDTFKKRNERIELFKTISRCPFFKEIDKKSLCNKDKLLYVLFERRLFYFLDFILWIYVKIKG